jgi:ribonuclease HI
VVFIDGEEVWRACESLQYATNNEAEYRGLLLGLTYVSQLGRRLRAASVRIEGDSELVINQAGGSYKCHSDTLRPLLARVKQLVAELPPTTFAWCSREDNEIADGLAASGLDGHDTVDERRAVLARHDERGRGRGGSGYAGRSRSRSRERGRGGGGDSDKQCYACGERGHVRADCRRGGGGGGGGGYRDRDEPKHCYICGQAGHVRADCTRKHCFSCGQMGHVVSILSCWRRGVNGPPPPGAPLTNTSNPRAHPTPRSARTAPRPPPTCATGVTSPATA